MSISRPADLLDFSIEYLRSMIDLLGDEENGMTTWLGEMYFCIDERQFEDCQRLIRVAKTFNLSPFGQGQIHLGSGDFHFQQRDWEAAKQAYSAAIQLFKQTNHQDELAIALTNLGRTLQEQGRYDQAVNSFNQAAQIYQLFDDKLGLGQVLSNIGSTADQRGDWEMAITYYYQAMQVFAVIEADEYWISTSNNLGVAYESIGQWEKAEQTYMRCVDKLDQLSLAYSERGIRILVNLGSLYAKQRLLEKAIGCMQSALTICQEIEDIYSESTTWNNLGTIYAQEGKHQQALECYEKHLHLVQQIGDYQGIILGLNNLGSAYEDLRDLSSAEICFTNSLHLSQEINDFYGTARSYNNLGVLYEKRSEFQLAMASYQKGLTILEEIGDHYRQVVARKNIATMLAKIGLTEEAQQHIEAAWMLSEQNQYTNHLAGLCILSGDIAFYNRSDHKSGCQWYSRACQYASADHGQLAGDLVVQIQKHLERMAASSKVLEAVEFSTIIEAAWMGNELGEYAPTFSEWLRNFRADLQHG